MTNTRQSIYDAIDIERNYQDVQWGGPAHDDTHEAPDWIDYIRRQSTMLMEAWDVGTGAANDPVNDEVRMRLVRVAALAVAAIESHDRKVAALKAGRP